MEILKRFEKFSEAVNNYYGFALIVYTFVLFIVSDSVLFLWALALGVPLIAGWGGYLLRAFIEQRAQRYGFAIISDTMTYEIGRRNHYTLRYTTKLRAQTNHLMVYPVCYQWSGSGKEGTPKLFNQGQQLLAPLRRNLPYETPAISIEGNWHYWFVAFNPPVHKNKQVEIKYLQEFQDTHDTAKPYVYYFVRSSMQRLELNVKFPAGANPRNVRSSYIKPTDPNRPYLTAGVVYDKDMQWVTWTIHKPKRGYSYRIDWQ